MRRWKKILLQAVKIAIGSSAAIYIAEMLGMEYASSAGIITLLTLMTTKWDTLRLSIGRLMTFAFSIVVAAIVFTHIDSMWLAFGIYILVVVAVSDVLGLRATISVNAVIGTHLMTSHDFSVASVENEAMLVVIGITIALILNLFHANHSHKKDMISDMRYTEERLQMIMGHLAAYLSDKEMQRDVWDDIRTLEKDLQRYIREANEYQDNTFHSHPGYYIDYFEMRYDQCQALHNLHYEMQKIRKMPRQAQVIADYMIYLMDFVVEHNVPTDQINKLEQIFEDMRHEALPETREEFESRAMLYHILMDIEEFLKYKKKFVEGLSERQRKEYWK